MKMTTDSRGRLIFFSEPKNREVEIAYSGCDFITIEKDDVKNLISLIGEIVDIRNLISADDPRCISFERLIDRNDGICYEHLLKQIAKR